METRIRQWRLGSDDEKRGGNICNEMKGSAVRFAMTKVACHYGTTAHKILKR